MAFISAFLLLGMLLATQGAIPEPPSGATPQKVQFSVYVHDKETKIVSGLLDMANANAYGTYNFNSSVAGWNFLEISANKNPSSSKAHLDNIYAMGFAEGYASCNEIHTFWPNFYSDLFGDLQTPPGAKTLKFIKDQWDWMGEQILQHAETDAFWYAQKQTRHQLQGLFDGYRRADCGSKPHKLTGPTPSRPNGLWATLNTPTLEHFLLINAWGDLYQITVKMKEPGQFSRLHGRAGEHLVPDLAVCPSLYVPVCMCICVYVYMCICVYVCMCVPRSMYLCVCVCVYMCICVYVCMCVCVYVCMCVCVYVCMCVCVYVYMRVCVYVYMCICVYVYVYMHDN